MEGKNLLRTTVVEKREVAKTKIRCEASGLIRNNNVEVDQPPSIVEQDLFSGRLNIGCVQRGSYRLGGRKPWIKGKNESGADHFIQSLQCGHHSHLVVRFACFAGGSVWKAA